MTRTSTRLASLVLALILVLLTAATVFAAEQTVTVNLSVTVPLYNKTAMGSLVLHNSGDPSNIAVAWSFTGTVEGKKVSASGQAKASYDPSTKTYKGWITSIDSWSMGPIMRPDIGSDEYITLHDEGGQVAKVTFETDKLGRVSTPLTFTGVDTIPAPFGGDFAINVTNDSSAPITVLPRTGEAPFGLLAGSLYLAPLALVVLGGALLLGTMTVRRGRSRAQA